MSIAALCVEQGRRSDDLRRILESRFELVVFAFDRLEQYRPDLITVFDIALTDPARLPALKAWVAAKPPGGRAVFVVSGALHLETVRANAVGATHVLHRPLRRQDLMASLLGEHDAHPRAVNLQPSCAAGVAAGTDALQSLFAAVCAGAAVDAKAVDLAGAQIVQQIGAQGLDTWVETVRRHHSQTYQHCLLVTGVAVAFGKRLGVSEADQQRLSIAGMLHDLGKANIPLSILEKPGPLDADEMAIMRKHPQLGAEALAGAQGMPAEMREVVLHHHEYLDGSGYPHGLAGQEIGDFVRLMTIADVFGALLERRAYKPPMSNQAAYQILLDMGAKLDVDLVRAFRSVALPHRPAVAAGTV